MTTLNRDAVPIGDDIESVEESRADVEIGNEEDEEPLEADAPRARMNPKIRTCCLQELVCCLYIELNCWRGPLEGSHGQRSC